MKKVHILLPALCLTMAAPATAYADSYYELNYDESVQLTRSDRSLNKVGWKPGAAEEQSIAVSQASNKYLYQNLLDKSFTAKAGETITPTFAFNGTWMHRYVFIDYGNDGKFDVAAADGVVTDATDIATYSYYGGKDSKGNTANAGAGAAPPSFQLPADMKEGVYRVRYKIDWDDVDPGGSVIQSIVTNGGCIVDTRLIVHGDNVNVTCGTRPNGGGENGVLLMEDGTALTKATIPFGQPYTIKLQPTSGYKFSHLIVRHGFNLDGENTLYGTPQYVEEIIPFYLVSGDEITLPASMVDGDMEIVPFFSIDDAKEGDDYALNFDKSLLNSRTDCTLSSIKVAATKGGNSTIEVANSPKTVYQSLLPKEVSAVPGDVLTTTVNYEGSGMHAYLYVDLNNDGAFSTALNADGTPSFSSELLAFSYHNGKNSLGAEVAADEAGCNLPAFTIPVDLPKGMYRARLKIDNDNIDPAGRWAAGASDQIDNGGYVVDFLLNVHNESDKLDVRTTNGSLVRSGNAGMPLTVAYGKSLGLLSVPAADGYSATELVIRHGHNIDGEQFVRGNQQWEETTVALGSSYTVPANLVNGELRLTANFEPTASAEYELVFADEFNDGSQIDQSKWKYCPVGHGITWKRLVAQTEEGRQQVNYIEDGKLVQLCKPNTIADEKNGSGVMQQMISGAIESSSNFSFKYGKVEARIMTNPHSGNFPAFWMMPKDQSAGWPYCGEIDIWEQINAENRSYHTIHSKWANGTGDGSECQGQGSNPTKSGSVANTTGEYHIFGFEWTETLLSWYVDGKKVFSYAKSNNQSDLDRGQWPFDKPFYLILNQSVGNGGWAAAPDINYTYKTMTDWVRVYQTNDQQSGVEQLKQSNLQIDYYTSPGSLLIVSPSEQPIQVADLQGRVIYADKLQGNKTLSLTKGIYLLNGHKVLVP